MKLYFNFGDNGRGQVLKIGEELLRSIGVKSRFPQKIAICLFGGSGLLVKIGEQLKDRMVGRQAGAR